VQTQTVTDFDGVITSDCLRHEQSSDPVIKCVMDIFKCTDLPLEGSLVNYDNADVRALFAQRQTLEIRDDILYGQFQRADGTVRYH